MRNLMGKLLAGWPSLGESLGRLMYPPHCLVCSLPNAPDEDRYLCRSCRLITHDVADPTCPRCGMELGPHETARPRCASCRNVPLRFDRAVAAARHAGAARQLVLALKFAMRRENVIPLSKMLARRLCETGISGRVQMIIPVPLHRRRRRERGFNQSELLAREVGRLLDLPVRAHCLRRVTDTPPQTLTILPSDRRANVKGAFAVRRDPRLQGKTVLLVDDVLTTGATTDECAAVLKRAGVKHIFVGTATRRMRTPARQDGPEDA
jgi:ComF family protein